MIVKNDGNFGSKPDHRCFAKNESADNSWKSKQTPDKLKLKHGSSQLAVHAHLLF